MNCGNSVKRGLLDCRRKELLKHLLVLQWGKPNQNTSKPACSCQQTGIGPLTQSLTALRSVDTALCEAEGMILWQVLLKGSVESLALAQALSRLHSSGASCPMLSLLTLTEAPEATKDLLCWPLLTLASSHLLERGGQLQKCLIMLTPQQRMHLQTTGVYVLSLWGTFLYSKGNISGPDSSRHFLCGTSDVITFHLKYSFNPFHLK